MDHGSEKTVLNNFWRKMAQNFARVPFAEDVAAAWYCAFDPATPTRVKATLVGALAYFILPFDVIPDFLIGLGFTDDLAVLLTAFGLVKNNITQSHRDRARVALASIRAGVTPEGGVPND